MALPLSIFIIACNEAQRIGRTIAAVRALSEDIVVVDSGSADATPQIATALGARVIQHAWAGYGPQKRFAEEQCRHDWLFNLDADEVASTELVDEIRALFDAGAPAADAYVVRIVDIMPGDRDSPRRWPHVHRVVRLYDRRRCRFSTSSVHDVVVLPPGATRSGLRGAVLHYPVRNLGAQIDKFNRYTDALAIDLDARGVNLPNWRIYVEFPLAFLKAFLLRRYFLRGTHGFIAAINHAFYRHLRLAKHYELRRSRGC